MLTSNVKQLSSNSLQQLFTHYLTMKLLINSKDSYQDNSEDKELNVKECKEYLSDLSNIKWGKKLPTN